jgi:hypothetical protein
MSIKKKLLVFALGFSMLITLAELNLTSITKDYERSKVAGVASTNFAYYYLPIRQFFTKKHRNAEHALSVAFFIARLPEKNYVALMKNGGRALWLLKPIALDNTDENKPWQIQAAYEALLLLVRMPLDTELRYLSDQFAKKLNTPLKWAENSSDPIEVFQIKEVLSMYVARKLGEAKLLEGMLLIPDENTQWRNDLATVRVVMAACAQNVAIDPDPAKEAFSRGFSPHWLRWEKISGWDVALIQTVIMSNTSEDCKKISQTYQSMINFIKE